MRPSLLHALAAGVQIRLMVELNALERAGPIVGGLFLLYPRLLPDIVRALLLAAALCERRVRAGEAPL